MALLNRMRIERQRFLYTMESLTAQAYYEDRRIIISLGKEARPPFPKGHDLEQGDWSLLYGVKKRPIIYREC